jgi:hypothetical protein
MDTVSGRRKGRSTREDARTRGRCRGMLVLHRRSRIHWIHTSGRGERGKSTIKKGHSITRRWKWWWRRREERLAKSNHFTQRLQHHRRDICMCCGVGCQRRALDKRKIVVCISQSGNESTRIFGRRVRKINVAVEEELTRNRRSGSARRDEKNLRRHDEMEGGGPKPRRRGKLDGETKELLMH